MSQVNNNLDSSSDSDFPDEPTNVTGGTSAAGNKRHRIIMLTSSPKEGPSLPKYIKLSAHQETETEKNEENLSGILNLPAKQTSPVIAKLSPLVRINVVDNTNTQNNLESLLCSEKSVDDLAEIEIEKNPKEAAENNNGDIHEDASSVAEKNLDNVEQEIEPQKSCNVQSNEIISPSGENEQSGVIVKNLCDSQVTTPNGITRLGFLLNGRRPISVDSQTNSKVIHDHVYLERNEQPSTSDHLYQVANISDDSEHNEVQASRYTLSDINLAQLILGLKQDIHELTSKVEKQGNILSAVVSLNQYNLRPLFAQNFPEKYNLPVPFVKIEDFLEFNENLSKNIDLCNEFIASLCSYIDNNITLSKNILNMIRVYMSKDLAVLFTAIRPSGNKMILKDTLFCKCLLQAAKLSLRHGLLPLEFEKAFLKHLGLVIGNAKSWHEEHNNRENSQEQL